MKSLKKSSNHQKYLIGIRIASNTASSLLPTKPFLKYNLFKLFEDKNVLKFVILSLFHAQGSSGGILIPHLVRNFSIALAELSPRMQKVKIPHLAAFTLRWLFAPTNTRRLFAAWQFYTDTSEELCIEIMGDNFHATLSCALFKMLVEKLPIQLR